MYTNDETRPRDLSKIEKPAVSITVLIFSVNNGKLEVVLINRVRDPFNGYWSLPGDILPIEADIEEFARTVLHDKTGISNVYLEQLFTFGELKRDPRGRVIAVTYFALMPHKATNLKEVKSNLRVSWTSIDSLPVLAFDHRKIIDYGLERIKNKLEYSNIAHGLLPDKFRLSELQEIYEIVLGKKLDKRNFRKKILSINLVRPTREMYREGNHRPAKLYRFSSKELVLFD